MLFLLPIPISLVLACAWAAWVSRPRKLVDPSSSVAEWDRACEALAPAPPARSRRKLAGVS